MSENKNDDGILSRWSRRKLEGVDGEAEADFLSAEDEQAGLDARAEELQENRAAAEAIDLDTIDEESDLSLFMKEGVPEMLKKAALAKLWRSSPIFANVDGLVDYDDNFADPNLIMKTFTSAYQVGKGYLKEVLEENEADKLDDREIESADNPDEEIVDTRARQPTESTDVYETEDDAEELGNSDMPIEEPTESLKVSLRHRLNLEG